MRNRISGRLLAATAFCLVNSAVAKAADNGLESADGTLVTNPSGTTIEGDRKGIYSYGVAFNLENAGTIRGNGTAGGVTSPDGGVVVIGGSADIDNRSTISGQRFGITTAYIFNPDTGLFEGRAIGSTVQNSGTIIGDTDDGIRLQGGGSVTNLGYIAGRVGAGADGISIFPFDDQDMTGVPRAGSVTNNVGAVVEGNRYGIILSGGGTVDNAGTVSGNTGGVVIQTQASDSGRTGGVTNSGTINGLVGFFSLDDATLDNSGTISASVGAAVESNGPLSVNNGATGSITGATRGIFATGSSLTLDNAGTIRGNGTTGGVDFSDGGVVVTGGPADITNAGSISGQRFGITMLPYDGIEGRAIGSTVDNTGSIIGDTDDGIRLRGGGSVTNSGYIAGRVGAGADGISMFAYDDQDVSAFEEIGSVTNFAGATIEGNRYGIILSNGGTVSNAGTITGNNKGIHIQAVLTDPGRIGTIINSGTINGGVSDFGLASFDITNEAGGSITAATDGVYGAGSTMTLDNAGTIRGNGTTGGLDFSNGGVVVTGGPADITNAGTISGQRFGITMLPYGGTEGRAIGSSVDNSGFIIGDTDDGIRLRGGGTVTNSGYIAGRVGGGADGISMFTYDDQVLPSGEQIGSVTNFAGATIEGNRFGIILSNGGTVSNAGTITGFSSAPGQNTGGVHLQAQPNDPGRVGSVTNSGTINGGVSFFGLASSSLNNSGTISSTGLAVLSNSATSFLNSGTLNSAGGTAALLSDFGDAVTLQTGSAITGTVDGAAGTDSVTLSGSSNTKTSLQEIGQFANFETLNVLGGYWTAPGSTGTFGSTTVSGGTFAVDGSITSPITVNSGATLAGVGTITGNVTVNSGGVLSPGNSIGTISVTGNVALASGSTFLVETTPAGLSDLLAVTGTMTLGSGSALQVLGGSGTYGPRTAYTIVTASGGINGKFGSVTTDLAFVSPQVATKSTSMVLTLTRNSKPIRGAATSTTIDTADAIALLDQSHPVHAAVLMQTDAGARLAFNALSGGAYSRLGALMAEDFGRARLDLASSDGGGSSLHWGGVNAIAASGSHAGSSRSLGPISLMMVGGGYATRLASDGMAADVQTRFVGSAVGYRAGRLQALAGASSAWHDVSVARNVTFAGFSEQTGARYAAQTHRLDLETSYWLSSGAIRVAPYGGYSHILTQMPAMREFGGFAALAFERTSESLDQLRLGFRAGSDVALGALKLSPRLDVAFERMLGDVDGNGSARFVGGTERFDSSEFGFNRRTMSIDGGMDLLAGPVTVTGRYRARLGDRWSDHSGLLGATLRF